MRRLRGTGPRFQNVCAEHCGGKQRGGRLEGVVRGGWVLGQERGLRGLEPCACGSRRPGGWGEAFPGGTVSRACKQRAGRGWFAARPAGCHRESGGSGSPARARSRRQARPVKGRKRRGQVSICQLPCRLAGRWGGGGDDRAVNS